MPRDPFNAHAPRGGLFDQSPAVPAAPSRNGGDRVPLTVTQVCDQARGVLDSIGRVCVLGEVSNFSGRTHWYFSIKDAKAVLGCVMWERTAQSASVQPCNGMEVVVTGKLTYYAPSARTQLVVESIERRGTGSLQQRLEELCRVLRSEGYFDESRKRRLPTHPRRIAVITSKHGAALQDVLRTCAMRAPFVDILVVEVAVQGEAAAPEIVRAIRAVDRRADELGIDAMIITRGGGSLEDLWAFNDRAVADAVFQSTTPVVAAIGHETDTTVIELVADRRASTPTQAAMLLLPDRAQLGEHVGHLTDRLSLLTRKCVRDANRTLTELQRRLVRAPRVRLDRAARKLAELRTAFEQLRPATRQALARQRLESLRSRLNRAQAEQLSRARQHAENLWRQLRVLGPEQVLARGYSLTFAANGSLLRRAHDTQPGAQLTTKLAEGSITVTVNHPIQSGSSTSPPVTP